MLRYIQVEIKFISTKNIKIKKIIMESTFKFTENNPGKKDLIIDANIHKFLGTLFIALIIFVTGIIYTCSKNFAEFGSFEKTIGIDLILFFIGTLVILRAFSKTIKYGKKAITFFLPNVLLLAISVLFYIFFT
ncbi:MAG: hypothetical protein WCO35_01315 [Candidatus Nomurabacteria bacterium]